jgi:hypothetical protein
LATENVPGTRLESIGGNNFGSLLAKLAKSSESFESEDKPLDNMITLSAILKEREPETKTKP